MVHKKGQKETWGGLTLIGQGGILLRRLEW
jgi:hypothetical protein